MKFCSSRLHLVLIEPRKIQRDERELLTRLLTKAAQEGVERVYRDSFRYSKAEVLLLDLSQRNEITGDLFAVAQPVASERLMGVLDAVNGRWGRGAMRLASVPVDLSWGIRREMMSQSLTTWVDELWRSIASRTVAPEQGQDSIFPGPSNLSGCL